MNSRMRGSRSILFLLLVALGAALLVAAACGGDDDEAEPTATNPPAETDVPAPTTGPATTTDDEPTEHEADAISFNASPATITVDGDDSDWAGIQGTTVTLEQIEIPEGVDWDEPGPLDPVDVVLKVATDSDNVYVLLEVPDDYDFVADDHNLSPALAVMFLIDPEAGPHMGATDEDLETGLGMVDIWHWELDCAAGVLSGGGGVTGGDDTNCNLDDEYATDPETREDDGEGDVANPAGENSLAGVWEHTARASGNGAVGAWVFGFSRPLQSGDPQDAQVVGGGTG
ncbi:MAG: ethylbenzene dehydrogenase-related protein, partial [Pirellulales bacterium]